MTALKEYDRLEATGLWRETPDAQRRDVMVSFGKATLIIRDKSDAALAHWSLPAIERLNPGVIPALFRPGSDAVEELELSEPSIIEAIEKVRKSVARTRPRSGRLRGLIFVGILASILGLCYFWLPDALVRHTVSVVPESKRLAIGQSLVGHIGRLTGGMCRSRNGNAALNRLKTRVLDENAKQATIMRASPDRAIFLPGGIILLGRGLVEDHETPDVLAGFMLNASTQAQMTDPLEQLLDHIGARETLHLLTTGQLKDEALRSYAETLIGLELPAPPTEELLRNFKLAEVASTPYAYARDLTGEATLELIEADPYLNAKTPPILSDGDWVTLQEICSTT